MDPEALLPFVGALAGLAWLTAVGSWVLGLRHLREEVSVGEMLTHGMRSFDPNNYTETGRRHHQRFKRAFGAFFAVTLLGAIAILIAASTAQAPPPVG